MKLSVSIPFVILTTLNALLTKAFFLIRICILYVFYIKYFIEEPRGEARGIPELAGNAAGRINFFFFKSKPLS